MLKFNVVKDSPIWFEGLPAHLHNVPTGSFYGKITLKYNARINTGIEFVRDKTGAKIILKNGMPKMRTTYKNHAFQHTVWYIITNTTPHKFRNYMAFDAYIKFDDIDGRWIETTLVDNRCLEELNNFIMSKCETRDDCYTGEHSVAMSTQLKHVAKPCEKKAQSDYLYRGVPMKDPHTDMEVIRYCEGRMFNDIQPRAKRYNTRKVHA